MHRLFERQLAKARQGGSEVDLNVLASLVGGAYEEAERDRARTDRSVNLMAEELERAHTNLLDAFEAVPEGLVLFDSKDRLKLWNKSYAALAADMFGEVSAGAAFEDMHRIASENGRIPAAIGRAEQWLAERLRHHQENSSIHEEQLADDRWIRIVERRTSDGGSIGVHIDITDIKRREESFRLLFDSNPVPMWVSDNKSFKFLAVNDAALTHYGYSREQFLSLMSMDLRPPEDREQFTEFVLSGQRSQGKRYWRHRKADGSIIEVAVFARVLTYNGQHANLVAIVDVTERKRAEDKLRSTQQFMSTIVENVPATIIVKDARDFRYVLINRAGEQYYGISREHMLGKTALEVLPKESADHVGGLDKQLIESLQIIQDEHTFKTPDRRERIAVSKRIPIFDAEGNPEYLLAVIDDITEKKEAQARIAYLAHHDSLTELPNRTAFNERIAQVMNQADRNGRKFGVMCIDLDRFKEVNDVFGHKSGDELLKVVATRLKASVGNAFLSRLGGDEFIVIVDDVCEPAELAALAERMQNAFDGDIEVDENFLRVGLSIGIAIYPNDGADPTTLVGNADAALYRVKAEGRGSIRFFAADIDYQLRERRLLQHDLRSAIARKELVLNFQPQARIDGTVTGFEVLLRWKHSHRGTVMPGVFIPVAEESGLIIEIGEWVLREACREAASWPQPLNIAVNLSPVQFKHGDLPALIHEILIETGLSPRRLEIEVTESVLIGDFTRALSILRRLKTLGIRIAMDDFGTGYSSLSYLQSFPFDKIKIDQTFIANLGQNLQSAPIIRAVIGLGHGLSVPIAAEGVETREQLAFLSRENCDEIQGYLIGRPNPIEYYDDIIRRQTAPVRKTARAS